MLQNSATYMGGGAQGRCRYRRPSHGTVTRIMTSDHLRYVGLICRFSDKTTPKPSKPMLKHRGKDINSSKIYGENV